MERFEAQPVPESTPLEKFIGVVNRRLSQLARIVGLLRRDGLGLRLTASYLELEEPENEPDAPAAGTVGHARLYVRVNGANKLELCVRFQSGAAQIIATEP